jgi:hypothetical protein
MSMPQLREMIGGSIFSPLKWMGRVNEAAGKDRIQIYEDTGEGYREEQSYFVQDAYVGENSIELELSVSGDVHHLRIDPAMDSCVCRIREFTVNGEAVTLFDRKVITINGRLAGDTMVFADPDPNINLHLDRLEKKASNRIWLSMELTRLDSALCRDLENELRKKIRL